MSEGYVVSGRVKEEILEELNWQCAEQRRTRSQVIAMAIEEWLERQKSAKGKKR